MSLRIRDNVHVIESNLLELTCGQSTNPESMKKKKTEIEEIKQAQELFELGKFSKQEALEYLTAMGIKLTSTQLSTSSYTMRMRCTARKRKHSN